MTGCDYGLSEVGDRLLVGRLSRPRTSTKTRIAVVGDPHVATRSDGTYRVFHRTEQRLRTVIDDVNERDVDLVVFPGDLTKDGEPWNYDRLDALLEELDRPYVATPGNHDVQKKWDEHECPSATTFAKRYGPGPLPARREVGDLDLFVLDSTSGPDGPYTGTHRGRISEGQLTWLDEQLETTTEAVVTCHHNPIPLAGEPLCQVQPWFGFTMEEHNRFRSVLQKHDVSLVLTGHHHLPFLGKRDGIGQLIAPAVASYPQAYCLLEIDGSGTTVWLVSHAGESGREEAYQLAADGPPFRRSLLGITENVLADLPLLYEPSPIEDATLNNSV